MKIVLCALIMALVGLTKSFAQERNQANASADSIHAEAMRLFQSEFASWYGTDIFMDKFKHKRALIGGYLSYANGKAAVNVFFGKGDNPDVLSTISFDATFNGKNYRLDTTTRKLNPAEQQLRSLRITAAKVIGTDTLFKHYQNTNYNLVPLAFDTVRRVYVLTGPQKSGEIILGNDYLLEFDRNYKLLHRRKLHKNIMVFNTKTGDGQKAGVHTHLPESGSLITATDICALMLYKNTTDWATHYVFSKNYVSIWEMRKNLLAVMTLDAWNKLNGNALNVDTAAKKYVFLATRN